ILPPFVPATQPPLPQNLRFTRVDVVFEQALDWWSSNAPATYVDPRENCRNRVKREEVWASCVLELPAHVSSNEDEHVEEITIPSCI
ncbi:unnamed protein product, partial [Allacma fusca]